MKNQPYNTILHVYELKYYNIFQIYKDFGNLYLNFFHHVKCSLQKLTYFWCIRKNKSKQRVKEVKEVNYRYHLFHGFSLSFPAILNASLLPLISNSGIMGACSVEGCKSRSDHGIQVYKFPEAKRVVWGNLVKPGWIPGKNSRICEVWSLFSLLKFEKSKLPIWILWPFFRF